MGTTKMMDLHEFAVHATLHVQHVALAYIIIALPVPSHPICTFITTNAETYAQTAHTQMVQKFANPATPDVQNALQLHLQLVLHATTDFILKALPAMTQLDV